MRITSKFLHTMSGIFSGGGAIVNETGGSPCFKSLNMMSSTSIVGAGLGLLAGHSSPS